MSEEPSALNGQISELPSVSFECRRRGQWAVTQSLNCLDWINRDKLGNPISGPQLCNLEECEYKYGCSGIFVALQDRLVNLLNCLNYAVSSLKVVTIFFYTMSCRHAGGNKLGSFSVCVRRSNLCLWRGLMHGNSTFWLTQALNSLKTTDCVPLDWTFCGVVSSLSFSF